MNTARLLALISVAILLSGCIYYPREISYYEPGCDVRVRKLVLETETMQAACSNQNIGGADSRACLGVVLAVSAASAVVSGSIVVVGNIVYWLEKQGNCVASSRNGEPSQMDRPIAQEGRQ